MMPKRWIVLLLAAAVSTTPLAAAETLSIIPRPQQIQAATGVFTLSAATLILHAKADDSDGSTFLVTRLTAGLGLTLPVKESDATAPVEGAILLTTSGADPTLGDEGYSLDVTPQSIIIRAPKTAGLFYGVQSLLQLLPPAVFGSSGKGPASLSVPCVQIKDKPRFAWRGLMLDVARHFEPKEQIIRLLNQMAMHKLNSFHWHLTDDQGWRIEIKKYPLLTTTGGWRSHGGFDLDDKLSATFGPDGKYGGFYTQDEIKEVVAYAAKLHIQVVPEIEMPGHAAAALRSYPQYSTVRGHLDIDERAGIFQGIYDPSNEETFTFLQDVLTEVIDLFPSPYLHIGGDEVPKKPWLNNPDDVALMKRENLKDGEALQSYFVGRIGKFLSEHHRHMVGWDEILEGGIPADATVMSWRGIDGGRAAAAADHDVVMSPEAYVYLDGEQSAAAEPHVRGNLVPLQKTYEYEPIPSDLPANRTHHILGLQGNLWTEYVPNMPWAEYMLWPRGAAIAEVGWTEPFSKNWPDFERRLAVDEQRLDAMNVNHRPLANEQLAGAIHADLSDPHKIAIDNPFAGATVRYTTDDNFPAEDSATYDQSFGVPSGWVHILARYFPTDRKATPVASATFLDGYQVVVTSSRPTDWTLRKTYFYSPLWSWDENDVITISFVNGPQALNKVAVDTGTTAGKRLLLKGVLEISEDGKTFTSSGDFDTLGAARADLNGKSVAAIRIRATGSSRPPIIRAVSLQ